MEQRALTRKQCENAILRRLEEIRRLYKRYNPDGDYLSISINNDIICVNNEHWAADKEHPLDFYTYNGNKGSVV